MAGKKKRAKTFSAWLRRRLEERAWSQAEAARRIGVSTAVVSRWVNGQRVPGPAQHALVAAALGVDVGDIPAVAAAPAGPIAGAPVDPAERIADRIRGMRLTDEQAATLDAVLDVWGADLGR